MMADPDERDALSAYVNHQLRRENIWTKLWSLLHHGFVFSAATLSALAALTLQLKSSTMEAPRRADVAAVLAASASLFGVISASGGFGQKWRANRITKGTLEQLQIDLLDPSCDLHEVRAELKDMKRVHHLAIIGEGQSAKRDKV